MRHTNQQPLRLNLSQAAQQKLTKAAHVFKLREHWFHDRLPPVVERPTLRTFQFVPHALLYRGERRQRLGPRFLPGFRLAWRHMQIYLAHRFVSQRRGTEITTVSRSSLRHSSQIGCYRLQHRHQLLPIIPRLHHFGRHDDLRLRIHPNLTVVCLLITLRYQILHDPRIRISEVALTFRRRQDLPRFRDPPFAPPITSLALCYGLIFLRPLPLSGGFRFGLHLRYQGLYFSQAPFSITQLWRQLITTLAWPIQLVLLLVDALCLAQQLRHYRGQLLLLILQASVAERFIRRGVGFDLRAINGHMA